MFHYTYVIHHPAWGFFYIGVRSSKVQPILDLGYWGSSKYLDKLRTQIPRGWVKEIIFEYETRAMAGRAEPELIDPYLNSNCCINRSRGGMSWYEYSDDVRQKLAVNQGRTFTEEVKSKMRAAWTPERRAKAGELLRNRILGESRQERAARLSMKAKKKCND